MHVSLSTLWRSKRTWRLPLCASWLALVAPVCLSPAEPPRSEYDVKAAFLLNFTKFVEWPPESFADTNSPISICILGKDPFGHTLDDIVQGETVNGRKLAVRRIAQMPASNECQVVYVATNDHETGRGLANLGAGVLTVGDGESFIRDGGMIAFIVQNRRVRFDIKQSAADNAGLKLSSKLLSVARSVQK